jgi:hypothetical protein
MTRPERLDVADAVLKGKGEPLRAQHSPGRLRRLEGRVGIREDDGAVDGRHVLHPAGRLDGDPQVARDPVQVKPVPSYRVDVLLPEVDERHVEAGPGEQAAVERAHAAGADDAEAHQGRPSGRRRDGCGSTRSTISPPGSPNYGWRFSLRQDARVARALAGRYMLAISRPTAARSAGRRTNATIQSGSGVARAVRQRRAP